MTKRFDPDRQYRRSIRLQGYDYAQAGAYFITICTRDRRLLFDDSAVRQIAERCWLAIPDHATFVELDEWVLMPNHVHGIIVIGERRGVQLNARTPNARTPNARTPNAPSEIPRDPSNQFSMMSPRRNTLSVIVRTYKAAVTTACRENGHDDFGWQRSFYEHIIRNERELNAIREYIANNPSNWRFDLDNLSNGSRHPPPESIEDYLRDAGINRE